MSKKSKKSHQIKVRGRVSTTVLERGQVVEVEHTEVISKMLKSGFLEEVEENDG